MMHGHRSINVFPRGEGCGGWGDYPRALNNFEKFWGLISHLHVRGTPLCHFKNPLDLPSYLDLIVSRFSS